MYLRMCRGDVNLNLLESTAHISYYNHLHKSDIVLQCEALNVYVVFSKTFALNARAFRFNFCLASVLLVPKF